MAGAGVAGLWLAGCGTARENELVLTGGENLEPTLPVAERTPTLDDAAPAPAPKEEPTPEGTSLDALTHPEAIPEDLAIFPMGVSSGDVSPTDAIVWTCFAGKGGSLSCVVWEMEGEDYAKVAGRLEAVRTSNGFAHVLVKNLTPGKRYRFAFFEHRADALLDVRSAVGRFRAALADDSLEPLVFGAISCVKLGWSFATLAKAGERTDLDAFLLLGDTAYNDGATSLSQFRQRWFATMSTPQWRALRAGTSVFATWDDHELTNNWNPEESDSDVVRVAQQSWFENLPVRRSILDDGRIYRSTRWGRTAELFALDCRTERRPSRGEYISREQMEWLKEGLTKSPCTFKIILNPVPIGDFPAPFSFFSDGWPAFPAQRTEILKHIEDNGIPGVLWLSGDFHLGSIGRVGKAGELGSKTLEVLAGPGAQRGNPAVTVLRGERFHFTTNENNYVALHLNPLERECRIVFHDGAGAVLADQRYTL